MIVYVCSNTQEMKKVASIFSRPGGFSSLSVSLFPVVTLDETLNCGVIWHTLGLDVPLYLWHVYMEQFERLYSVIYQYNWTQKFSEH